MLTALRFTGESGWADVADLSSISDLVRLPGELVWAQADVAGLTAEALGTIQSELGLDPLAVEDSVSLRQRPKLEAYANHLFAVMHQLDEVDGQLEARQIACFIGPKWVLTVHDGSERTLSEAMRRCREGEKSPEQGTSFIVHALLDTIVDDYGRQAEALENEIESLEELALAQPGARLQSAIYSVKQRLSRLRRYLIPGERLLAAVVDQRGVPLITATTASHFRDVHDHTQRIIDQIRNVAELADAVIELQRAEQTHALNEVTKRLTGWAAIIAVPTFIASVYGMNFALLPREGQRFGFFFALAVMAASSTTLYVWFRRRGWI